MSLNPNAPPSSNFDLSDWKLQLPIDSKSSYSGKASEIKSLNSFENSFFYTGPDGAMVLSAPVEGATTGGSNYARSELREMTDGRNAEWTLREGGHLSATLQVDRAPAQSDGTCGKIVIGQVHGGDGQLVRLAWEDGKVFFANDITSNGKKDIHIELLDRDGNEASISLNETFSYTIDVTQTKLTVSVFADGKTYTSTSAINNAWADNAFYFKAGTYLGVNESNGTGEGKVSIFGLDVDHSGHPVSEIPPPTQIPTQPSVIVVPPVAAGDTTRTFAGTAGDDSLRGKSSNDLLVGGSGSDVLNGRSGNDILVGGAGRDVFVFERNARASNSDVIRDFESSVDRIALDDAKFRMLAGGFSSDNFVLSDHAHDSNDHLIYSQSTGELFYDRDGSGSKAAQLIATLENHAALVIADFEII